MKVPALLEGQERMIAMRLQQALIDHDISSTLHRSKNGIDYIITVKLGRTVNGFKAIEIAADKSTFERYLCYADLDDIDSSIECTTEHEVLTTLNLS